MPYDFRQRCFVLAVVLGTVSERFNVIWYGTVVALDAVSKGIGGVWVGWWIFVQNLSSWIVCGYLTVNFAKIFPAEIAAFWLLNSSAILLGIISMLFGVIGFLPSVPYNIGNFVSALIRGAFSAVVTVAVNTVIMWEFKNEVATLKMYAGISYTIACILSIFISYAVYFIKPVLFLSTFVTSVISLIVMIPVYFLMPRKSSPAPSSDQTAAETNLDSKNPLKTAQQFSASTNSINFDADQSSSTKKPTQGKWKVAMSLCKVPEIFLALLCQVLIFAGLGAHGPLHSPFLQDTFGLEAIYIGMVSCAPFIAMACGSAFFGIVGKTLPGRKVSLIGSLFLLGFSSMLEGPDPWLCSVPQTLYVHITSLFISAFAFSSHLVLTAEEMRHAAIVHGFPENIEVSGAIASFLGGAEYLSGLVGPIFGGYLGEMFGFERAFGILGIFCFVLGIIRLAVLGYQDKYYKKSSSKA
ncbi:uncharacterized protein LOC142350434 [Convolutriloba macropyga]|uniref:uncharacterized protein LOC142350434 n=1 Tax=Convolutriloba macropyga TaxID=536237 RepID=UPI003F51DA50